MSMDLKRDIYMAELQSRDGHYTKNDREMMRYIVDSSDDSLEACMWKARLARELEDD